MSRFELPKGVRDLDSIINEYRPKKWRGNHTESDRAYDDFANPIDQESIGSPVEGDNVECSPAIGYPAPFSPSMNSSAVNVRGHNDEPGHPRLDQIAEALRTLTYGEMLELAESMWKVNSQGSGITESDLPNVLYRWSTSRSIEN
jgi:hypothetical protein